MWSNINNCYCQEKKWIVSNIYNNLNVFLLVVSMLYDTFYKKKSIVVAYSSLANLPLIANFINLTN